MSGNGQFQGATVLKALVQRGFKLYPDGVWVVLLGLGLMTAHHLDTGETGQKKIGQVGGCFFLTAQW